MSALQDAVKQLDPSAIAIALAASGSPVPTSDGGALLAAAFAAFLNAKCRILAPGTHRQTEIEIEEANVKFAAVVKTLLAAGAKPPKVIAPGWVPSQCSRGGATDRVACSQPFDVALATERAAQALRELVNAGYALKGVCNGRCGSYRIPVVGRCCVFMQTLFAAMTLSPSEYVALVKASRGDVVKVFAMLVPAPTVRFLVSVGAGEVEIPTENFGDLPAAHFAILRAVLAENVALVQALLGAGVPADWSCTVPLPPPHPRARKTLLSAALEQAIGESNGNSYDLPSVVRGTRETKLASIADSVSHRSDGPCHAIVAALLRAGVPKSLATLDYSPRTGNVTCVLSMSAARGNLSLTKALLAAGADPNALAGYKYPASVVLRTPAGIESPLEQAAGWGHRLVVAELLAAGAVVTPRAFAAAAEHDRADIIVLLGQVRVGAAVATAALAPTLLMAASHSVRGSLACPWTPPS